LSLQIAHGGAQTPLAAPDPPGFQRSRGELATVERSFTVMESIKLLTVVALCFVAMGANADVNSTALGSLAERCQQLASVDLSRIEDAPTKINEATLVGGGDTGVPSHCQVTGYVTPSVGFLLRLPLTEWNDKFLQMGCGGSCGSTTAMGASSGDFTVCVDSVRKGYACVVSDNGHNGSGNLWAYNNPQAQVDHAYRGMHVTSLAAKAIVEQFFQRKPRLSYFWGCSTGGRQALIEAQLFPHDFDGIIAGCPSINYLSLAATALWNNRALVSPAGKLVLGEADIDILHQAVINACDMNDGLKDGLIGDPRACRFDPKELLCAGEKKSRCLTPSQVASVSRLYDGPSTSSGERIYFPGAMRGSEKTWLVWFKNVGYFSDLFRYMGFDPAVGPRWNPSDFDFDRDYKRLGIAESLYSGSNPDLRRFKAAGGKLLSFVGWNDAGGMALPAIDYYETVERVVGSRAATQSFFRLFAVPGMDHCGGGDGAFAIDWLGALEQWVEYDRAPDRLFSAHVRPEDPQDRYEVKRLKYPIDLKRIEYSRPVYPYPLRAHYLGSGDPDDASSFGPVAPE
jgi:hypothetical protein